MTFPVLRGATLRRAAVIACSLAVAGGLTAACSSSSTGGSGGTTKAGAASTPQGGGSSGASSSTSTKALKLAYLSFAVANSYDAPMLAAAKSAAAAGNASLTVFDANNSPQTQFSQFQNAITSGGYDGIIVQPILGTGLTSLVTQAIGKGIKVVNIDQILGPDYTTDQPQVTGLSANITFIPSKIGTQLGQLAIQACQSKSLNPCKVGYMYDIKASTLDVAIHKAFTDAVKSDPAIKLVAEGEDFFTPASGLKAAQNMMQAHSDLNLIVASDQGLEGATQALSAAGKTGKILMVGFGGSTAGLSYVKSGAVFGDVAQAPASEGKLGVEALIKAIRTGTDTGGVDPVAQLPDQGVVTQKNLARFTAEWPG
jgi:ribose transport system substrate-binding protein